MAITGFYSAARLVAVGAMLALGACAYEVAYRAEYVPAETPPFVAQGKLLIVLPQEQREFTYSAPPTSATGDFTTLTVPIGSIVQDIAKQVFGSCFAYGVEFVDSLDGQSGYVFALQGNMQDFVYSYSKVIEAGFGERNPEIWIKPEVDISFAVKGYNSEGALVLDKTYDSGVRAGESYLTTNRPAERINRALHETLHALMLDLANDVRPLLMGSCEITDKAAG
jgi:hypothetical protein